MLPPFYRIYLLTAVDRGTNVNPLIHLRNFFASTPAESWGHLDTIGDESRWKEELCCHDPGSTSRSRCWESRFSGSEVCCQPESGREESSRCSRFRFSRLKCRFSLRTTFYYTNVQCSANSKYPELAKLAGFGQTSVGAMFQSFRWSK